MAFKVPEEGVKVLGEKQGMRRRAFHVGSREHARHRGRHGGVWV